MADTVQVRFSASIKDLIDATNSVKSAIDGVAERAVAASETMRHFGEVLGIGLSLEGLKRFIESMGDLGEKTERMAAILGVSTEEIGRLDSIAKGTGTSTEQIAKAFEVFQGNLHKAMQGSGEAAEALRALGLSARQLINLPLDQQIGKFADAVSHFADGGTKLAAVRALLGRTGDELIPTLDKGAKGFADFAAMGERAGTILDEKTAKGLASTRLNMVELGAAIEGAGIRAFRALEPAIDDAVKAVTRFIEGITGDKIADALGEIANVAIEIFETVSTAIEEIFIRGKYLTEYGLAAFRNDLRDKMFAEIDAINEGAKKRTAELEETVRRYVAAAHSMFTAGATGSDGGGAGGSKPSVPTMQSGGQIQAQMEAFQNSIKLNDEKFKAFDQELTAEVKLHQITEDQKTQQLVSAIKERQQYDLQQLDFEEQLGGLSVAQRQKIEDLKKQFVQKSNQEIQQAQAAALQADVREWEAALKPIESAWNSQLRGLLAGTETFAQAMKKIFADLAMQAIEKLESIAMDKLATQLASQFGGLSNLFSGGGAGGAAGAAGAAGSAPQVAATTANTTALSALTTAIAANTTALTGEAAAAAGQGASSAGGGIISFLSNFLPGFAGGGYLGSGTLGIAGEAGPELILGPSSVIPAGITAALMSNLVPRTANAIAGNSSSFTDSRTTNIHYNVSGVADHRDQSFVRSMAKAVVEHWKLNPTTRPKGW